MANPATQADVHAEEPDTRGARMAALRRQRMADAIPFLRGGFRPFFLGAAIWAAIAVPLWLLALGGDIRLPSAFDALAWHRHEMLFGFVGAAIAGFLLTAIPNWTGRLPIAGGPLAGLAGLWLAGRLAMLASGMIGAPLAMALDLGFFLVLAAVCAREVIAAKNRNLPAVLILLLLALASGLDHAAAMGVVADADLGVRLALVAIITLVSLIGGRIVPSFTRNWMMKEKVATPLPEQPGTFDKVAMGLSFAALLAWAVVPAPSMWTGALLLIAGLGQAGRLARWRGWRSARKPIVFILHVAYAWIPIGLILIGLHQLGVPVARSLGVHALTAGAMATMILAVMTRASLGHTGRPLEIGPAITMAYGLVTLGAFLRVVLPVLMPGAAMVGLWLAAVPWVAAMGIFAVAYWPVLTRSRLGDASS